jgi:hypothetical protein
LLSLSRSESLQKQRRPLTRREPDSDLHPLPSALCGISDATGLAESHHLRQILHGDLARALACDL